MTDPGDLRFKKITDVYESFSFYLTATKEEDQTLEKWQWFCCKI